MKFQDDISNMNTYIRTYIRTSRNQYVPYFFKVGGIIKQEILMWHFNDFVKSTLQNTDMVSIGDKVHTRQTLI